MSDDAMSLRTAMREVTAFDRCRRCGMIPCADSAGVEVKNARPSVEVQEATRAAKFFGVMMCNSVHVCAVCSERIRAEKGIRIMRAVAVGEEMHPHATWTMLTATIRHDGSEPLRTLRRGIMRAWRRMRQRGSVQRVWKKRVFASVRAVEVKHGAHGWHPHLHLLVLTTGWTDEEKQLLVDAWRDAVLDELGERAEPDEFVGLKWSKPRANSGGAAAHYLAKLGLEMTHVRNKGRGFVGDSRTQWDIARDAAAEMKIAKQRDEVIDITAMPNVRLWREYETAMKGVRCIEMDDRMAAMAKRGAEKIAAEEQGDDIGHAVASVRVRLDAIDFRAIRRVERHDPLALKNILAAAARDGPLEERAIIEHIDEYLSGVSGGEVRAGDFVRRWMIRKDEEERGRKSGAESQFRQQDRFVDLGGGFLVERNAINVAV